MDQRTQALQNIQQELERLVGVLPLIEEPGDVVPGEGSARAVVVFIGEAPGAQEQERRRPFVGRSGQLLRKTLQEVGIDAAQIYITNIVKTRPPGNRDPTPAEITAFAPFLDQELTVVAPQVIVTLGRFSMQKFLPKARISEVHGKAHEVVWQEKKVTVIPMYHPAAALRSTAVKTAFVQDFMQLRVLLYTGENV
jgi:uracil-DNA glycosylase